MSRRSIENSGMGASRCSGFLTWIVARYDAVCQVRSPSGTGFDVDVPARQGAGCAVADAPTRVVRSRRRQENRGSSGDSPDARPRRTPIAVKIEAGRTRTYKYTGEWRNGRRGGLKIPFRETGVRVQIPPRPMVMAL